jgi:hypothetical protein
MKFISVVLLTFLIFVAGCPKDNVDIIQVKVWDMEFRVIRKIDDPRTLGELKKIWEDRVKAPQSVRLSFTHKVDIAKTRGSTRWLYDPNGYATVLTKAKVPIYRFANPMRLAEILIPQQGAPADANKQRP